MRRGAAAVLGVIWGVGCGARRAPPEPAFDGPLTVEVPGLQWTNEGLEATLLILNPGPGVVAVESVDWSVGPVEQVGLPVDARLQSGCSLEFSLQSPAVRPSAVDSVHVSGTVHIQTMGGYRRPVVFHSVQPVPSSEGS